MSAPISQEDYLAEMVADGEARVARQIELVMFLDQRGHLHEARMARELLATITETVQAIACSLRRTAAETAGRGSTTAAISPPSTETAVVHRRRRRK